MQAETESGLLGPLEEWLDRIARPIEFATRDDGAHLKAVTNLSDFISTQVLSALRQQPYPKAIEARLISLRVAVDSVLSRFTTPMVRLTGPPRN